jgi:formamidopyrimidine-DNA glycosylase
MPELPEVETVKRGLEPAMAGKQIAKVQVNRAGLRYPFPKNLGERLAGQTVLSLNRRAKYILARLDGGEVLLMHLGMSGRFTVHEFDGTKSSPGDFYHEAGSAKHDHVVVYMEDGTKIVYTDPRRFGIIDLFPESQVSTHKLLASLGVEPLGNELTADFLNVAFRNRKTPLKSALLDQKIIAGLGNIYVCEALFRTKLSPRRQVSTITSMKSPTPRLEALVRVIRDVLNEAIAAGGSSLRDFAQSDGELGYFQHNFQVYDREGLACVAPGCDGTVERITQSGRSTFFCPHCQR